MVRWLKEPLVHFLLLGALLFIGYEVVSRGKDTTADRIVVTQGRIESLSAQFQRTWNRPPTEAELDGLIQNYIREEVLYREGVALGLDRDDQTIRNRVRLKMEVFAEGADVPEATEAQLQDWLDSHRADFAVDPEFSFRQVYFDPARHGGNLQRDVDRVLARLRRAEVDADPFYLGDVTLLPAQMEDASLAEVRSRFGPEFASAVAGLRVGQWQGPLRSTYGMHLVQLARKREGHVPNLDEVRAEVNREWTQAQTRAANERFYQELLRRYTVTIERPATEVERVSSLGAAH
jgi:PPIC-type PPIASE domain